MRRGTLILTLAFGLGVVGLVSADEGGNWFTRLFTTSAEKSEKPESIKPAAKSDVATMPPTSVKRGKQAEADLLRRQDVCMKLRDIANAKEDEDMLRKVEQLEQRAYELYVAAGKSRQGTLVESSVKKGDR